MPFLPGGYLVNAAGDRILDSAGAPLLEAGIQVVVAAGGVLTTGAGTGLGGLLDILERILDGLSSVAESITAIEEGMILASQMAHVSDQLDDLDTAIGTQTGEIAFLTTDGTKSIQTVLDAIALIAAGGLTTEEHEKLLGLTSLDTDQIASAVWGFIVSLPNMLVEDDGPMVQTVLVDMARYLMHTAGYIGLPVPDRPFFNYVAKSMYSLTTSLGYWTNTAPTDAIPDLDLSLVQSGDTVWDYLQREYTSFTWLHAGPGDWPIGGRIVVDVGFGEAYFVCTLTDADIRGFWPPASDPAPTITVTVNAAPVWPGASGVTYGSTVALTDQLHLAGAMDGVLVAITTPPTRLGQRSIGGMIYDYNVGEVAFETDEGDLEPWQYAGFRQAIFTPKTMKRAGGVRFRVLGGAEGTVTPWTVS